MVNFCNSFIVLAFLFLFILDVALRECFVEITDWHLGQIPSHPFTQNPVNFISTLSSLLVQAVRFSNVSPVTGRSCGSIWTSLHTSVSRFVVKSRRSLCLILMNPLSYSSLHVEYPSQIRINMLMECLLISRHTVNKYSPKIVLC